MALSGHALNGTDYIQQALTRGAAAVLWESGEVEEEAALRVEGLGQRVGEIASRFYRNPSAKLKVAAVTGTDGKSSVVHFLATAMAQLEGKSAHFGTLGCQIVGGEVLESTGHHTTPPPLELQRLFAEGVARGVNSVAIEASSHGIEQGRLAGVAINSAVLTQLGRDHLDYHGSLDHYRAAKRALFYRAGLTAVVVNQDDELGQEILRHPPEGVQRFAYSQIERGESTLFGEVVSQHADGMLLKISYQGVSESIRSPLYGRFNLSNLLAVLGVLMSWEIPFVPACAALQQLEAVAGRMEPFCREGGERATLIVDYAHTPGALASALKAVHEHLQAERGGKIWLVFGCGGERDRGKRPLMGRVAEQYADHLVLTNDNPRGEAAGAIIEQILVGIDHPQEVAIVEDRAAAIRMAYQQAGAEDIVLIAGKGHEQIQWIGTEKIPLSDRGIAQALVSERGAAG
jgi:UDP-N-acetylmuramoyl-L-alanyl-D-glutamate--2,6-diaminopimelate ligase